MRLFMYGKKPYTRPRGRANRKKSVGWVAACWSNAVLCNLPLPHPDLELVPGIHLCRHPDPAAAGRGHAKLPQEGQHLVHGRHADPKVRRQARDTPLVLDHRAVPVEVLVSVSPGAVQGAV